MKHLILGSAVQAQVQRSEIFVMGPLEILLLVLKWRSTLTFTCSRTIVDHLHAQRVECFAGDDLCTMQQRQAFMWDLMRASAIRQAQDIGAEPKRWVEQLANHS